MEDDNDFPPRTAAGIRSQNFKMRTTRVFFPADIEALPQQLSLMAKAIAAMTSGESALLESPTGTGKSLAILCSARSYQVHLAEQRARRVSEAENNAATARQRLAQLREKQQPQPEKPLQSLLHQQPLQEPPQQPPQQPRQQPQQQPEQELERAVEAYTAAGLELSEARSAQLPPKVYLFSRTHSQISQLCAELKRCPDELTQHLRMTVLASRDKTCINQAARNNATDTHGLGDLQEPAQG
jgi:Fanconi anemia group J protein